MSRVEMQLLVILGVHEVVVVAVGVEELHLHFVHGDLLDGIAGAEAVLEHGAGAQVAQLGLDEGAQVAGGAVLHAEHRMQIVVVLDDHAGTHLCGWNRHADNSLMCFGRAACRNQHPLAG